MLAIMEMLIKLLNFQKVSSRTENVFILKILKKRGWSKCKVQCSFHWWAKTSAL